MKSCEEEEIVVKPNEKQVKDTIYRPNIQMCCEGRVHVINEEMTSCEKVTWGTDNQTDKVCGNKPYSSQHHHCCGNVVTSLTERCRSKQVNVILRVVRRVLKSLAKKIEAGKINII
uniref:Uncharacterized protein n=1 Tax=Magallana gigas TaxID=29159 RepID=A0A8W8JFK4_MAGGI